MRKFAMAFLLLIACAFKSEISHATDYDDGYINGFIMAVDAVKQASDNHPEWALVCTPFLYRIDTQTGYGIHDGFSISNNPYQQAMLAVNYVNAQYTSALLANVGLGSYYQGVYDGFLAGTAAAVLWM